MSQPFDEKELMDRVGDDVEFLAETVQMLGTDGPALMNEIRAAIDRGDAADLARTAHALKGMISNFCSPQTAATALAVEQIGKRGDLSAAPAAAVQLQTRLGELTGALNEFLATRS